MEGSFSLLRNLIWSTPDLVCLGEQSWSEPVPGTLRMVRPSGIAVGVVNFDMGTVRKQYPGWSLRSYWKIPTMVHAGMDHVVTREPKKVLYQDEG